MGSLIFERICDSGDLQRAKYTPTNFRGLMNTRIAPIVEKRNDSQHGRADPGAGTARDVITALEDLARIFDIVNPDLFTKE